MSLGCSARISTRSPPRAVSCNSPEAGSSFFGIATSYQLRRRCEWGRLLSRRRQIVEMTRREVTGVGQPQFRFFDAAAVEHVRAARVKPAAFWRIDRARHVAL